MCPATTAARLKVFKLSSNETPLGPSPRGGGSLSAEGRPAALYPDGSSRTLREALAAAYGLNPERIVCGAGSDELLDAARAYLSLPRRRGDLHAARLSRLPDRHPRCRRDAGGRRRARLTADVDAILAAVTPRTRLVYLANPNNPTGTYLPHNEVSGCMRGCRGDVLLVLDAAYAEYVRRNDYERGSSSAAEAENVVMTRTFSKIYGLAGLRSAGPTGRRSRSTR